MRRYCKVSYNLSASSELFDLWVLFILGGFTLPVWFTLT